MLAQPHTGRLDGEIGSEARQPVLLSIAVDIEASSLGGGLGV